MGYGSGRLNQAPLASSDPSTQGSSACSAAPVTAWAAAAQQPSAQGPSLPTPWERRPATGHMAALTTNMFTNACACTCSA